MVKRYSFVGSNTQADTTHEASYLPFIFSSAETSNSDESSAQPRGRRTFNSKGKEVKKEVVSVFPHFSRWNLTFLFQNESKPTNEPQDTATKRLTSISGFKAPPPTKQQSSNKAKAKTAQELIREGVGAKPSAHLVHDAESQSAPTGFVKPAGVDAPSLNRPKANSTTSLKRERDLAVDDTSTNKKRKKKKEVTLIE